ncbi:LOW QUALITY PROTEIN: pentatricopeptide repeat-containing protein At1g03560, mitochondrial-like [Ananas comosus]|uniref:LOW QUALITY PROTEIN: pentatricopeptide repeat-containing protein At1g03560, mitochondrial-like n=1 Tax=Ananas comosus TaxID=4615 RepID=A0A6P5GUP2_ANACO|nr:LOW QUALITY PROTEIN: pentatricopeptide repeat-containing protein At1g03560, mitochondrial-like [Ananas comosus]
MVCQWRRSLAITSTASSFSSRPSSATPSLYSSSSSTQPLLHPPPEWVEPFVDLSDLAPHRYPSASPGRANGDEQEQLRRRSPSPWLARIVGLVLQSPSPSPSPSPSLESQLDDLCRTFLLRLSPAFVSHVLRSPDIRRRPGSALCFFRWASSKNWLHHHQQQQQQQQHLLDSYVSLLHAFASSPPGQSASDRVRELVAEMLSREDLLSLLTPCASASLIQSLGALGLVEELLCVWRRTKEIGIEPSLLTYNCLMDGLVNSGFVDSAEKVFRVMEQPDAKARPDVVSRNILIKGYCKAGRTQDALNLFGQMQKEGAENASSAPDKITYLTLIQSHYGDGAFLRCLSLYREMEEKGLEIPPHACTLVIAALCKEGKPFEASAVLERMLGRGCGANVAIYTALIDSFAKCGAEEQAMSLFRRMKDAGLEPDAVTYSVLINCLCKSGKVSEAMEWFRFCSEKGVPVNTIFYSSLIDGFGKAGSADRAEKLFHEMVEKGFVPDSHCYNALLNALVKAGRVDDACALFKRMDGEGCHQTVYTYTILIEGMFKRHKNEEALKLWGVMIDKGIAPTTASFRVLSTGLCLSGKFNRACKILDELAPMGVVPETAYEDMINVLCKAGRFEHACRLADGIVEKGREVPGRVRTFMINALRKAGNADLAIKLVHSKIAIGYDRFGSVKRRILSNPILLNAIKEFSPLKLRLGGTLQDKVIYSYDTGDPRQNCTPFVKNDSEIFGFSGGCLSLKRWDELNDFFRKAGALIIFRLNALNGRVPMPDGSLGGPWNYSNAASFIRYTVNRGYTIHGWELGNELSGNGVGARVGADQYAADAIALKSIIDDIYQGFPAKPLVIAPGGFFDAGWFSEFITKTKPSSLDVITHHIYNLGPGVDDHLIDKILDPSYLDGEASTFSNLQGILKAAGTKTVAWVGEAGGAYNSGHHLC